MLRLFLVGLLAHAASAYFDNCPRAHLLIQKANGDCPPEDDGACDESLLVEDGCVMSCSRGVLKFQDQTSKWTVGQAKVTFNAELYLFVKSSGGAARDMYKPTCVTNPSATLPPVPAPVVGPKTLCPYSVLQCTDCDATKLYLDYYTTDDASMKCDRGYTLLASTGGEPAVYKTASCQSGSSGLWDVWRGLPMTTANGPAEKFTCRKDAVTTPVTCPTDTFLDISWCTNCDKSKLRIVNTEADLPPFPRLESCRLQCDRGFKLVATQSRATDANFYRDIARPTHMKEWIGFIFAISKIQDQNLYKAGLGTSPYVSCIADTVTTPVSPPSAPVVEPCGCPYSADISVESNDHTKLFIQDSAGSGNGNCTVQCDTGYRLVRGTYPMSSVTCKNGAWAYISADTTSYNPFDGKFSCQPAVGSCPQLSTLYAPCRPGMECTQSGVRPIKGAKSACILSCGKGYRLWEATAKKFMAEVYIENGGWKGKILGDVMGTLSYKAGEVVSVNCERYFSPNEVARLPTAGALTACGCDYRASLCPTCDWKQLFVLDGFGASSGQCTIGCAKGYMLEGANMNVLSCRKNLWIGSNRNAALPLSLPRAQWLTTSCVPVPESGECVKYTLMECDGCDKSKIRQMPSVKGKSRCVLTCDKGFRLVYMDASRTISRAQEAVLQQQWQIYPLGEVEAFTTVSASDAQFSCEPAAPIPAIPATSGPACGCPYVFKTCPTCDPSQLIGRHDGAGTCTLSCGPGYQMVSDNTADGGVLTAANCYFYRWFGRTASLSGTFTSGSAPAFSCVRTTTAKCASTYSPLSVCATCDSSKLRILPTKSTCQLGCASGFRLVANSANSLTGAVRYAELTAGTANAWSGVTFESTLATLPNLFVGCEPDTTTKPLARCGCPYSNSGPEFGKLVPRTVWPDGNNCELMCEPGYRLKQTISRPNGVTTYDFSLVVCQAGKWTARDFTGSNIISLGSSPALGCVKATTDYIEACSAPTWLPLQCPGCSTDALLPVASGYTCQFTCRAGWRLIAQHRAASVASRPRAVSLRGNEWIGTGGQGLLTTLYYGVQPLLSCEPDTYPPAADPAPVPKPPAKPCEYCKLPTAQATCPAGKSCVPEFLPLWKTTAGCMQVRCQNQRTMLINKSTWTSTDGLNCEADGTWKTTAGVAFPADVAITCDANTGGNATLIEVVYNIYRKGISLIALDPNYKSTIGG